MNNKEAIKTLNSLRLLVDSVARGKKREQIHEAIDYAIGVLNGTYREDNKGDENES